jgi:hypothetical protein
MHENAHLCLGLRLHQRKGEAFVANGNVVLAWRKLANFLDGEDESGLDGSGGMGRLDDDEREVFGGVVNESKEAVGAR